MTKISLKNEPVLTTKFESFPYQHDAVLALRDLEFGAIFHEQGLGKTKIAIDLMLYWLQQKVVDTVILVVKKSLMQNWLEELAVHCSIKPRVLSSNRKDNFYVFNSPVRLVVSNYESIKCEKERIKLFSKTRDVGVILDESAKIKSPESEIAQTFFELSSCFKRRVIMTGTPVANRPYDIWAQVYFLDQGKSLGTNFGEFKRETNLDNDLFDDVKCQIELENKLSPIFSKLSKFAVRETKKSGVIELPDKIIESVICYWEPRQRELYFQLKNELRLVILKNGKPVEDISESVLKRLLRLVQVASNPRLVDDGYSLAPGKFNSLYELLRTIINNGEKTIIWTSFNENAVWLARELVEFSPCTVYGKLPIKDRNINIERFKNDVSARVLIATPGSAKEGLTLTIANNAIFYDRGFSLDDYLQAQDRIHRISQQKTCYVYNLIMQDSIDEWVDVLLAAKHSAAQLVQNDIGLEEYRTTMSYEFGRILREILGGRECND
ncbi:MAG: DEAD/DEAH box helicase [Geobacteraceae bacterium]|nr:DEAD/DEAH box helicase [Geobacteraceae bacterium]